MSRILKNASFLMAIQLGSYVIPLIELPFLARTLSLPTLGMIVLIQSLVLTLSFLVEYGFNLTASRNLAQNINNVGNREKLIGLVFQAKIILFSIVGLLFLMLYFSFDLLERKIPFEYIPWIFLSVMGFGFGSFWYFQAYERMGWATGFELFCRVLYLALILFCVRTDQDALLVLKLYAVCSLFSALGQFIMLSYREKYYFSSWLEAWREIRVGWHTFVYKSSSSVISSMSVLVLGFFASPLAVSYYVGADKIIRAIVGLSQPLIIASYPYFIRLSAANKELGKDLIRKYCYISIGVLIPVVFSIYQLSPYIIRSFLGVGFQHSITVLNILLVVIPLRILTSIIGNLGLLAAKKDRELSVVTLAASAVGLLLGSVLSYFFAQIGMAFSIVTTEVLILLFYIRVFWR